MGISVSAILLYGFASEDDAIIEEITFSDDNEKEWDVEYAKRKGWVQIPYPYKSNEMHSDDNEEHVAWQKNLNEMESIIKKSSVEIDSHGHDFTSKYLAIKKSVKVVYCGEMLELDLVDFKVDSNWDDEIKDFCNVLGITYKKPKWVLVSSYSC